MISQIGRRLSRIGYIQPLRAGAGYTLIELILLTAILAVIIAVSTPQFKRTFSELELNEASFSLARLISYAQQRSILEGGRYKLILDKTNARYRLLGPNPASPGKYARLDGKLGRLFSLPRGTGLSSDKKEIIFYPDGHCDKAAIIFSKKNINLKITVTGRLGNAEIEKGSK